MKSLVTYFSYSGNTDRVAKVFKKVLEAKGTVDIQRLKPKKEIKNFLLQCMAARHHKRAELEGNVKYDASSYDLVLIGSPVWAFAPVPAMNTYLENLTGLNGKRAVILITSGSGTRLGNCFKNIRKVLEDKGASKIDEINIPDMKNKDEDFVASSLQKIL